MGRRKVLITGARGMLGRELVRVAPAGCEPLGIDRKEADLADEAAVSRLLGDLESLAGVLHAAGYTDVAGAETQPDQAQRDNEEATANLARACARAGTPLVVLSTDFVFDGTADSPYQESDKTNPLNVYGRSKLLAEQAALRLHPEGTRIVRTQWLYGDGPSHFPARILERARSDGASLRVVDDEEGSPTSTAALAPAVWDVLLMGAPGIYHAACEGSCSRFEFARAVLDSGGFRDLPLAPCSSREFASAVRRPARAVLDCSRLTRLRGVPLPGWREALVRYLAGRKA